jgi:hypothetical protein
MRTNLFARRLGTTLLVIAALAVPGIQWLRTEAARGDAATQEVMRLKLGASQEVLRGLALQDFSLIRTNATRLSRLSQGAGWSSRQSPEYELFTIEFRRSADELARAAEARNVDAATIAYTQMTFSCVSCHKYMRGQKPSGG